MSRLNRRQFLKTSTAALGAAVLSDAGARAAGQGAAVAAEPAPEYEIYACKYAGPIVRKLAISLWNVGWDEQSAINFYVWAVKARSGEVVVVDTGCSPAVAAARKIPGYVNTVDVLARAGANAATVRKVVISHMHYDHVGNVEAYLRAFPDAKFYVQKRELEFCLDNPVAQRKPVSVLFDMPATKIMGELARSGRAVVVDGDHRLAPGLDLLLAPGHTLGLQVLRVNTAKGAAVVGSDCAHLFRGYREDNPSCYIMDMPAWIRSFDLVKAQAPIERIFPGHDVAMLQDFPRIAEDVSRLV